MEAHLIDAFLQPQNLPSTYSSLQVMSSPAQTSVKHFKLLILGMPTRYLVGHQPQIPFIICGRHPLGSLS